MRKSFRYGIIMVVFLGSAEANAEAGSENTAGNQIAKPQSCNADHAYTAASKHYAEGEKALSVRDFNLANMLARGGLEVLGSRYVTAPLNSLEPPPIDDTGMYLGTADMLEHDGRPEEAAQVRLSMLHTRIKAYRQGHNCGT